jgi:hypothetical protein
VHDHRAISRQHTQPLRWIAAAIVVAVLGWDVWQTVHEARSAGRPQAARVDAPTTAPESAAPVGHRVSAPE